MERSSLLVSARLVVLAGALLLGAACGSREDAEVRTSLSVSELLGSAPAAAFARALEPRAFRFPEDHGPDPDFRSEWWYVTGNLSDRDGAPYGFQLTFFRSALRPPGVEHALSASGAPSEWRTEQVYMAHLALSDGKRGAFHAFERFSRGAVGLAGATATPFRVWLEDWEIAGPVGGAADIFPLQLRAAEQGIGVSLRLAPAKPLVLQGDAGLSQKGPEPGNASFYYSFMRLRASGELQLGSQTARVDGLAWMDREWSTSALSPGQVGWDWFALQLDDGFDLMVYQLRRSDGSADPHSKGILVGPGGDASAPRAQRLAAAEEPEEPDQPGRLDGPEPSQSSNSVKRLDGAQVKLQVLGHWSSPLDGSAYPSGWRLAVPSAELVLEVTPVLSDQELDLSFRYWEGAVRVEGTRRGHQVRGRGYVELTGYTDRGVPDQSGASKLRAGTE
jgi:predicted secreted hydrolase